MCNANFVDFAYCGRIECRHYACEFTTTRANLTAALQVGERLFVDDFSLYLARPRA